VKADAAALLVLVLVLGAGKARGKVRLSLAQLRTLASEVGFTGDAVNVAAAVAMAESGGDPDAFGDVGLGFSRGLFQVNQRFHPEFDTVRLFDPVYNAQAALLISKHGADWTPWSTFKNGAYRKYMPTPPEGSPAAP
jgi:hypothetical protein